MVLYRAMDNLSIGVRRNEVFDSARLSDGARQILETRGKIAPVALPSVAEVWPLRVDALFQAGFNCFSELIMAQNLPEPLRAWRDEALRLVAPGPYQSCNCRRNRENAENYG